MYLPLHPLENRDENTEGVELLQPDRNWQRTSDDDKIDRERSALFSSGPRSTKTIHTLSHKSNCRLFEVRKNWRDRIGDTKVFHSGWRTVAVIALLGTGVVFVFNLGAFIWVATNPHFELNDAISTIYQGSCAIVREMNVWIHLVINIVSTLLLCASNYLMQVLVAPNREEINRAHTRRQWLHVGVPNIRNLRYIRRDRAIVYTFLFLSSVPLHLFFNSVVFAHLQANEYFVVPTTADWINGGSENGTQLPNYEPYRINLTTSIELRNGSIIPMYQNTSVKECFDKYNSHYVSDVGNVYLVQGQPAIIRNREDWLLFRHKSGSFEWVLKNTEKARELNNTKKEYFEQDFNDTIPFLSSPGTYPSNIWRCQSHASDGCDAENEFDLPRDRVQWKPYDSELEYCLIERVEEVCKLQFSFHIAIIIISANLVKVVCITFAIFRCRDHAALVTIGDAIASFLDNPDPTTHGRCLQTKDQVEVFWDWNTWIYGNGAVRLKRDYTIFRSKRRRWLMAPGVSNWVCTLSLYSTVVTIGIFIIQSAMDGMPTNPKKLWQTGFGDIQGNNLLDMELSLLGGVLFSNTPQILLSYMYIAFNALYTKMFVAAEWASYSVERKPLRVTSPTGQQRSTYWLGIPFRYAVPVTIASGFFHWLASQSLFKVQIDYTDRWTRQISRVVSTCGYSPAAIIATFIIASVIAGGGVIIGMFTFPSGMPLAGSNSAAISAACHPPCRDTDTSQLPIQWGVVTYFGEIVGDGESFGHCCFSSLPVEPPIDGHSYR